MDIANLNWLLASDGSAAAEHACGVARAVTAKAGITLEVIRVETSGQRALATVAAAGEGSSAGEALLLRGIPGVEIAHRAKQCGADLVVLGRRNRSGHEALPLGSTTDAVLRRHAGPCLMIPESVGQLRRMVLALDGTRRGLGILAPAATLAGVLGALVLPLHVCADGLAVLTTDACWRDPATQRVRAALEESPALGGSASFRVSTGTPVPQILGFVERLKADLLVLGVRRGGPPGEMGSGHIGRDLLRTAPGAILTIPI